MLLPTVLTEEKHTEDNSKQILDSGRNKQIIPLEEDQKPIQSSETNKPKKTVNFATEVKEIVRTIPNPNFTKRQSMMAYSLNIKKSILQASRQDLLKEIIQDHQKQQGVLLTEICKEFNKGFQVDSVYGKFIRDNFKKRRSYNSEKSIPLQQKSITLGSFKHLTELNLEKKPKGDPLKIPMREKVIGVLLEKYDKLAQDLEERVNREVFPPERVDRNLKNVYKKTQKVENEIKEVTFKKEWSLEKYQSRLLNSLVNKVTKQSFEKLKSKLYKIRKLNEKSRKFKTKWKINDEFKATQREIVKTIQEMVKDNRKMTEITGNSVDSTEQRLVRWLKNIGLEHIISVLDPKATISSNPLSTNRMEKAITQSGFARKSSLLLQTNF